MSTNQDFPANSFGSTADGDYVYLYNRTGGALVANDVAAMNDVGTNSTYDDTDGSATDVDKHVIALASTELACRLRVAAEPIAANAKGKFWVRGRIPVKVSSVDTTATSGAFLTISGNATTNGTVTAKQLYARPLASGTGNFDAVTVPMVIFGRTKAASAATAAAVLCDFDGDGIGIAGYGG